jgi:hypothetical protein
LSDNRGPRFRLMLWNAVVQFDGVEFFFERLEGDGLCGLVVRVPGYRSRGPGFHSRRYQIFWEVVGLERGSLSLVSTIEELLEWKSSGYGLENREYGRGDLLRWPRDTLYPQKLALTSSTYGGRSVGIVRLRTKTTEFVLFLKREGGFSERSLISLLEFQTSLLRFYTFYFLKEFSRWSHHQQFSSIKCSFHILSADCTGATRNNMKDELK